MHETQPQTETRGIPSLRRDLDYIPFEHEGERFVFIRDPLGLVREGQAIPLPLLRLLMELPPGLNLEAMVAWLGQKTEGRIGTREQVLHLVSELDGARLLESESYLQLRGQVVREFVAAPLRPQVMAGQAYPGEPGDLRAWLEGTLALGREGTGSGNAVAALVAPHIDPGLGAPVYAEAYRALQGAAYRRVIVLGVGHQLPEGLFSFSPKSFQTPLGVLPNAVELTRSLQAAGGCACTADDFAHRQEHSVEFQLIFLQQLLQGDFALVPVLCGSLLYGLPEYSRQAFLDAAGPLLERLAQVLREPDEPTLLVAGVDFSHIGPKFGHEQTARELEAETRAHDEALLQALCAGDADALWAESARVRDRYNVCGFSALATLLEVLPPSRGQRLGYALWHEEPTASAVSYAAAVFRRDAAT